MRIVQLSDLHYAPTPDVEQGLVHAERLIRELAPDLIIVSGDLTREGLVEQFVPVMQFLSLFGLENVRAIPGNRDYMFGGQPVGLPRDSDFNYYLTAPDTRGEADDDARTTPFLDFFDSVDFFERTKEVALVGLDSEPVLPDEAVARAVAFFEGTSPKLSRVFCTHRSLLPIPRKKLKEGDVLENAGDILVQLLDARVDLVLCAHLHRVHAWQISNGDWTTSVVNAPSLLDSSPGKENGLLTIDIVRRGEMKIVFHPIDGSTPRQLLRTGRRTKGGG